MRTSSLLLLAAAASVGSTASAQDGVKRLPTPGGEAVIPGPGWQVAYDQYHYAPARRVGDVVYISGVVIGRRPDGPRTPETFATSARRAFTNINTMLSAFGLTFDDVVMINSFHDWSAPEFGGDRAAQFKAFDAVKEEFMTGVHPAWTAVGTSGLISPDGIVEVQMIAHLRPTGNAVVPRR